jgi:hypothetical protein
MNPPEPMYVFTRKDGSTESVVYQSRKTVGRDKSGRVVVTEPGK